MNTFFFDDVQYPEGLFGGKDFFNPIIYSTEERVVGVGENDKPLYQKTIESGSIPADSDATTGLTNIESYHVIAIEVINLSNNTEYAPSKISMYNYQGAGTWYGNVFLANNELKFNNNSRTNAIKIRAVIQYTKTTDVAGSGKYNTLGVPNVHYTTDEQVIGTWFGETLYQKSYIISSPITIRSNGTIINDYIDNKNLIKNIIDSHCNGDTYKSSVDISTYEYNGDLYALANSNYGDIKYITLKYTKTS